MSPSSLPVVTQFCKHRWIVLHNYLWNLKEKKKYLKLSHMQWCSYFSSCTVGRQSPACPRAAAGETPGKPSGLRGFESLGWQCVGFTGGAAWSMNSCVCKTSLMRCGIRSLLITGFFLMLWQVWCRSLSARGSAWNCWGRKELSGLVMDSMGFALGCPTVWDGSKQAVLGCSWAGSGGCAGAALGTKPIAIIPLLTPAPVTSLGSTSSPGCNSVSLGWEQTLYPHSGEVLKDP